MTIKFIAHRGNVNGVRKELENTDQYLKAAYTQGYDVELDIRAKNGILYYGHDECQEVVDLGFIQQPGIWCHAKDTDALRILLGMRTNCFWHDVDACTLTSYGHIWCFPGVHIQHSKAIWLDLGGIPLPNNVNGIYGYCGDKINENINNGITG